MELKGAISKTKSKFRTIEVTGENEYMPKNEEIVKVPLLGKVTAGMPIEAIEQPDEFFSLLQIFFLEKRLFYFKGIWFKYD